MLDHQERIQLIRNTVGIGTAFWFNRNPPFDSRVPHTFIVIGARNDGTYLCVHGTSKVNFHRDKILEEHSNNKNVNQTFVVVRQGNSALFGQDTLIDGNKVWALKANGIAEGLTGFREVDAEVELMQAIVAAVNKSKAHSPGIKKCVRAQ